MLPSILGLSTFIQHTGMVILLVLGFGFVIFWHELGHFLAAKWVGIKVEQFAVGFGQALFSWRKGIGFRLGNTQKDYRDKIDKHLAQSKKAQLAGNQPVEFSDIEMSRAAEELGLGDTEYRLNWLPLGGYVKMLGQDDLRPDAVADDPRAFNRKSVGARMIVISAGVVMNVILAALMFIGLFMVGLTAQPAWVGNIISQSPAQIAGVMVGDQLVSYGGKSEADFNKITLDTALSRANEPLKLVVLRPANGTFKQMELEITPRKADPDSGFVALGFMPPTSLRAMSSPEDQGSDIGKPGVDYPAETTLVNFGEVITAVNGQRVNADDAFGYAEFDRALQMFGRPVDITIRGTDGHERPGIVHPHFASFFSGHFNLAGMEPRAEISTLAEDSAARGKLQSGDVIVRFTGATRTITDPSIDKFMDALRAAGKTGEAFALTVIRGGGQQEFKDLRATAAVGDNRGQHGLGAGLTLDEEHVIVGDVTAGSSAARAGFKSGDKLLSLDNQPLESWHDVHRILASAAADSEIHVKYNRDGKDAEAVLRPTADDIQTVRNVRYQHGLGLLAPINIIRKAPDAGVAVKWGIIETRDFILQFYVTIRRMFEGSVGLSNMMGPIGIFRGGVKFAFLGMDKLIWFLAMISANLAVVNFLPIPVVDGGHFVFLLLEKIKGKPLSNKAIAIAQYAGLAFLLAVVVFVTYHDIMRRF